MTTEFDSALPPLVILRSEATKDLSGPRYFFSNFRDAELMQ